MPLNVSSILEVGCGEGYIVEFLKRITPVKINAFDLDARVVLDAKVKCPNSNFLVADACHLPYKSNSFNLVLACEVLEHIRFPDDFLQEVARVTNQYCLIGVPNEPLWRIINFMRGAYVRDLGNTPGHVNHWNSRSLVKLLNVYFEVIEIRSPLPWLMVLCKK